MKAGARQPNPGAKSLHRLNRNEYANAIRDLLKLDVDVSTLLPADDAAEGFDNMADVLSVSPTLIQSYVSAAMKISRAAVGDPRMAPVLAKFAAVGGAGQRGHVEGLPLGTRGGLRVVHNFPLDAEYEFRVSAGGGFRFAGPEGGPPPRVDVTLNGKPVTAADPRKFRIRVPAGPQVVTVAMVDQVHADGVDELYSRATPRRDDVDGLTIQGPFDATGAGDTPSRREIFVCQPDAAAASCRARAEYWRAWRVPPSASDIAEDSPAMDQLLQFHAAGSRAGVFETGIQQALVAHPCRSAFPVSHRGRHGQNSGAGFGLSDHGRGTCAAACRSSCGAASPTTSCSSWRGRAQLHEPTVLEQQVRAHARRSARRAR